MLESSEEKRCTLSDKELVEAIHQLVSKQCKTGDAWLMTIPVDFNRDSDMLISELIKRFQLSKNYLSKILEVADYTEVGFQSILDMPAKIKAIKALTKEGLKIKNEEV